MPHRRGPGRMVRGRQRSVLQASARPARRPVAARSGTTCPRRRLTLPGARPIEFIDVHPVPPLGRQVTEWNGGPGRLPRRLRRHGADPGRRLQRHLDHAAMRRLLERGYADAADQVGAGLIPTWPANRRIPPIITIDHVLVDQRVGVNAVSVHLPHDLRADLRPALTRGGVRGAQAVPSEHGRAPGVVPAFEAGVQAGDVVGGAQAVPARPGGHHPAAGRLRRAAS